MKNAEGFLGCVHRRLAVGKPVILAGLSCIFYSLIGVAPDESACAYNQFFSSPLLISSAIGKRAESCDRRGFSVLYLGKNIGIYRNRHQAKLTGLSVETSGLTGQW